MGSQRALLTRSRDLGLGLLRACQGELKMVSTFRISTGGQHGVPSTTGEERSWKKQIHEVRALKIYISQQKVRSGKHANRQCELEQVPDGNLGF